MRRGAWLMLLLVGSASLLAHLPASLLDARLAAVSGQCWRLAAASGTVWQGEGQLMYVAASGEVLPMSRLAWRWQPAALRQLALGWQIDSDGTIAQARLQWGGVAVENLQLQVPVAAVTAFSPRWHSARLGGVLQLHVPQWQLAGREVQGGATLGWQAASSPLSRLQPFGSYALDAQGQGSQVLLTLRTVHGPLQMQGQGSYSGNGLQFAGTAASEAADYEALKPVLLMLGQPNGPTSVAWQLR